MAACRFLGAGSDRAVVSTGIAALDRVLPLGGIARGSLVEFLEEQPGSGAESIAAVLARQVGRGATVVVDPQRQFYPPAAAAWGWDLGRLVVVRPADDAEALWVADQALRSRAVGVVWLRRERLKPHDFRRLALAAESGEAIGIVFRPARVRGLPTWADVQLSVEPRPTAQGRRMRVEVTRCRGGTAGQTAEVELDDVSGFEVDHHETLPLPGSAPLACPAAARPPAGAAGPAARPPQARPAPR
jgi:protein ImuA